MSDGWLVDSDSDDSVSDVDITYEEYSNYRTRDDRDRQYSPPRISVSALLKMEEEKSRVDMGKVERLFSDAEDEISEHMKAVQLSIVSMKETMAVEEEEEEEAVHLNSTFIESSTTTAATLHGYTIKEEGKYDDDHDEDEEGKEESKTEGITMSGKVMVEVKEPNEENTDSLRKRVMETTNIVPSTTTTTATTNKKKETSYSQSELVNSHLMGRHVFLKACINGDLNTVRKAISKEAMRLVKKAIVHIFICIHSRLVGSVQ